MDKAIFQMFAVLSVLIVVGAIAGIVAAGSSRPTSSNTGIATNGTDGNGTTV